MQQYPMECEFSNDHQAWFEGEEWEDAKELAEKRGWHFTHNNGIDYAMCPDCKRSLERDFALRFQMEEQAGRLGIRSPSLEAIKIIQAQVSDAHYQALEEAIRAELRMQLTPEEMAQVDVQAKAWAEAMANNTDAVHQAFEQVRDRLNPVLLNDIERVGRQAAQDFQEVMNKHLSEQLANMHGEAFGAGTIRNLAPDQPNLTREEVADMVNEAQASRLCSPNRSACAFTPYQVQEQGEISNPEPHFFQAHSDQPQQEWRGLRNGFLTTYRDVDREDGSGERFPIAVRNLTPWFIEERWHRLGSTILDADNNKIADAISAERTGNEDEETAQLFATAPALYRVLWALCVAYEDGEEAEDMQPLFAEAAEVLGAATLVIPSVLVNAETGEAVTRKCLHPDAIEYLNRIFNNEHLPLRWEIDEA